jgi:ferredoxin-NADP reductase
MRWLVATVTETIPETLRTTTLRLDVPGWPGHRAGQHVDIRLTAADGYQAQRSYSIASSPGTERVEVTVVRFDDGEVSPYLSTVADVGDQLEVRGPTRTLDDVIYRDELTTLADSGHRAVTLTLTRETPPHWPGRRGRVDAELLGEVGWPPSVRPRCFVCGPTPFVEAVSGALDGLGHDAAHVKTERFGPTGG